MIKPLTLGLGLIACSALSAHAKISLNKAQECQAVLDFTSERIGAVEAYNANDVEAVQDVLRDYNDFLQAEHVTPGLMNFTGGDKAAAKSYQTQIDAYKAQLVTQMKTRYAVGQIYTDQAVAIEACYRDAPMSGDQKQIMIDALETIIALAQQEQN